MKINSKLLPIKGHFFLFFAGTSSIIPFLPVFAKQLGFDEVSVSIVFAVLPFMGMLAKPTAGWIADKFGIERLVFYTSIILTAVFYFGLLLVGNIKTDTTTTLQCSFPLSVLKICRSNTNFNLMSEITSSSCPERCSLQCSLTNEEQMKHICQALDYSPKGCYNDTTPLDFEEISLTISSNLSKHDTQPNPDCLYLPVDTLVLEKENERISGFSCPVNTDLQCETSCYSESLQKYVRKDSVLTSPNFWMFFIFNIIAYSSFSVCCSVGDAICFSLLEDKPENYGRQRVFGSIGWGGFTILAGYIVDSYSRQMNGVKDYSPALFLLAGLCTIDLIICVIKLKVPPKSKTTSGGGDVLRLFKSPSCLMFIIWCTGIGVLTSLIWQWLPWYLSDLANIHSEAQSCNETDHGATWLTLLLSLNMAIQCFIGEVPMFFLSGWILKKLGHTNTMSLVLAVFGLRFLSYSLLTNPWHSLPIEVLNGVTFGIFYSTMVSYASIISPQGMESTMQGIVGAAFEGAGVSIGSLVGGAVYKSKGGKFLFRSFGIFSVVFCLLHIIFQIFIGRSRTESRSGEETVKFNPSLDGPVFVRVSTTDLDNKPIIKGSESMDIEEHSKDMDTK